MLRIVREEEGKEEGDAGTISQLTPGRFFLVAPCIQYQYFIGGPDSQPQKV